MAALTARREQRRRQFRETGLRCSRLAFYQQNVGFQQAHRRTLRIEFQQLIKPCPRGQRLIVTQIESRKFTQRDRVTSMRLNAISSL